MAIYHKAIQKRIAPGPNDPRIDAVGIVYHVAVSKSDSLYDFFQHDGGIESHFYIRFDGTVEQYRDTAYEADANYLGNSWGSPRKGMLSVETEGMGDGTWTDAQIKALKDLTVWAANVAHGFPIRKASGPYSGGVGYHCQFTDWNPHAHSCPGPDRVKQFNAVFVPWFDHALDPATPPAPTKGEREKVLADAATHATWKAQHQMVKDGRTTSRRFSRLHKALSILRKIHKSK